MIAENENKDEWMVGTTELISPTKFIQLGDTFWLREDQIIAVEHMDSQILHLVFTKVFTKDDVYDFRGERAEEVWKNLQEIVS